MYIKFYLGVLSLINYEEQRVLKFGMFELHCDEFIRALSKLGLEILIIFKKSQKFEKIIIK